MTAEADAAVRGAFAGGAGRVLVNDSHGHFGNLLADELDPRAELIQVITRPSLDLNGWLYAVWNWLELCRCL